MDSLFHFILAFMAAMVVGLHKKHGLRIIFIFAAIAVLIDLDHWIMPGVVTKPLHTIFIAVLLPLVLFLFFYKYEKKGSIKWQSYSLILLVVLVSHLVTDYFYGSEHGVPLFWPFIDKVFLIPEWAWTFSIGGVYDAAIMNSVSVAFLIGFAIFMLVHFIEDFIFYFRKKHMSSSKALKKVFSQI